jgi:hypothetical protein
LSLFTYKNGKTENHGKEKQFILNGIDRVVYELFFDDSFCDVEAPPSLTLFGNNI